MGNQLYTEVKISRSWNWILVAIRFIWEVSSVHLISFSGMDLTYIYSCNCHLLPFFNLLYGCCSFSGCSVVGDFIICLTPNPTFYPVPNVILNILLFVAKWCRQRRDDQNSTHVTVKIMIMITELQIRQIKIWSTDLEFFKIEKKTLLINGNLVPSEKTTIRQNCHWNNLNFSIPHFSRCI